MALVTQTFSTPGLNTFTLPSGVTEFTYVVHGGGGGGSGSDAGSPGASGGAGAVVTGSAVSVASGATLQLFVGGGGGGGQSSASSAAGGSGGNNGGTVSGGGGGGNAGGSGSSGGGGGGGAASYIAIDPGTPAGGTINFSQTYASGTSIAIPLGITTVNYTVRGAQGGKGGDSYSVDPRVGGDIAPKGQGGQIISGTLFNVAGKTLSLIVGTRGQNGSAGAGSVPGGLGGGGVSLGGVGAASAIAPETWKTSAGGGGGGGDSAIRVDTDGNILAVIAGGGGGSGGAGYSLGDPSTTIYTAATALVPTAAYNPTNGGNADSVLASASNSGGGGGGAGNPGGPGGDSYNAGNHIAGGVGGGGGGWYNETYTTDASLGDTYGNRNESSTAAANGSITIAYTNVGIGDAIVVAGGGGGAGGAGNDGSGPSGFQFGGAGGTTLSTTQNLTQGASASNHGGDGGGGGGGGGGNTGGSAGFTPGNDADAGGGSGGGSYYNTGYHSVAPSAGASSVGTGGGQSTSGNSGYIEITYNDEDGRPDSPGNFSNKTNALVNTAYTTTETKTVAGINVSVAASSVNATIIKNGTNVGTSTTFVNGDTFQLIVTSSTSYDADATGSISYGEVGYQVTASFTITTQSVPPNIPDPFSFTDLTNQPLATYVDSNQVTISGLNTSGLATVSAVTAGASTDAAVLINGVEQGTSGTISNGDTLKLRALTSGIPNLTTTASVVVGTSAPVPWNVTTLLTTDTGPDAFNFTDINGATANTQYASNVVTITGINSPSVVAISTNFEVNINGSGWITPTSTSTISNNQTLQIRGTSGSNDGDVVTATVQVGSGASGSVTDDWRIATGTAADTTPDSFNFVDRNNQQGFVTVYSNTVIPGGFDTPTSFSASVTSAGNTTSQEVSFDTGNTWNPLPYTVTDFAPGTPVQLRLVTGSYASTGATLSVTIGGVSDTWTVSVLSAAPSSGGDGTWMSKRKKEDGYALGTVITVFRQADGNWGNLTGSNSSRYPGFIVCDGSSKNAADYPDLFDVIGNTYGGNGFRSAAVTGRTYTGQFNLPDFRNRRVFGTGNVDGNTPAAPSVVTRFGADGTGTGDVNEVGSEGGNWYIAKVDAAGTPPLEQIQGTGNEGTAGVFYALGTVNTTGYDGITARINYNVAGNMSADVGPLFETLVPIPGHTHSAASGRSLNVSMGLMAWGIRAMKWGHDNKFWRRSSNDWSNVIPQGPSSHNPGDAYSKTYSNFWPSPRDNSLQLDNNKNSGNYQYMGALDVYSASATANLFTPSGGMLQHNHTLSTNPYGDPNNAFTYGNNNGVGTSFGGAPTNNTTEVAFSSSETGIRANVGSFQLSSSKALIPTVAIKPNIPISLMQPFFRAKYLIKAF